MPKKYTDVAQKAIAAAADIFIGFDPNTSKNFRTTLGGMVTAIVGALADRVIPFLKLEQSVWSSSVRGVVNTTSSGSAYTLVNINTGLAVTVPVKANARYRITISASYVEVGSGEVSIGINDPDTNAILTATSTVAGGRVPLSATFDYTPAADGNKTINLKVSSQQTNANIRTDNPRIEVARTL